MPISVWSISFCLERLTIPELVRGIEVPILMKRALISQKLWEELELLVPAAQPSPKGGRPRLDDRAAFNGILFVLMTGIPWEELPQELGFGSGMTCWRRLRQWQREGVWDRLHQALLCRLRQYDQIDWSRASIDGASVASPRGARRQAPTPRIGASLAASATS